MGEDAMDATAQEAQSDDTGCMENDKGEFDCEMETSLDGTKQWLPQASPEQTPYVGQQFKTAEEGILFYQEYAKAAGFDVRHSTMRKTRNGEVAIKYMVCSREGFKPVNIRKTNAAGEVHIKPPKVANNKGRGKRLKSNKEKAMQKVKKKPRVCATCGGTNHDSRNCEEFNTYEED
nr:protein FAR1-RELATED SEQUENCE 5-like [Ipomoea batatas]